MKGKLLSFVLLCAAQLAAVQITAGRVEFGGGEFPRFTMVGPTFTVMGGIDTDLGYVAPYEICALGCSPGDSGSFTFGASGGTIAGGRPGTVDGVFYPSLSLATAPDIGVGSMFNFHGPDFLITDSLIYSARFTFDGGLFAYPSGSPYQSCVICTIEIIQDEEPIVVVFPSPIHGAGRVTLTLREAVPENPSPLILDTLVYEFEAIPEPATIWLVAVPVAALISRLALARLTMRY
jgi:hypothetical protein